MTRKTWCWVTPTTEHYSEYSHQDITWDNWKDCFLMFNLIFSGALVGLVMKAFSHFSLGNWQVCGVLLCLQNLCWHPTSSSPLKSKEIQSFIYDIAVYTSCLLRLPHTLCISAPNNFKELSCFFFKCLISVCGTLWRHVFVNSSLSILAVRKSAQVFGCTMYIEYSSIYSILWNLNTALVPSL